MMFGSVGVFPWMFQSFEMLTGVPITSPSHGTPLCPPTIEVPCWTCTFIVLHLTHNPKHLNVFFVKLLFPFYLSPRVLSLLVVWILQCGRSDLVGRRGGRRKRGGEEEGEEGSLLKPLTLSSYWTQALCRSNLASRLSFLMRHLIMFKHFEVISWLYIQKLH